MPREFTRSDRVSDAIQRLLGQIIPREIRDPRIGMVNINDVTVTRDMAYAKVYVTFVGAETEAESLAAASILNKAQGFLRTFIAKELIMRSVPKLQFIYDKTAIRGQELTYLINRALAEDSQHPHDDEVDADGNIIAKDDTHSGAASSLQGQADSDSEKV